VASLYDNLSATAQRLINVTFGRDIILKRLVDGTFDPTEGEETGATEQTQAIKGAVLPASGGKVQALDKRFNLGELTYQRLNFVTISGQGLAWQPALGDKVEIDGEDWFILGITPTNPNDATNSSSSDPILLDMALRI
jgi:hypothetical protein